MLVYDEDTGLGGVLAEVEVLFKTYDRTIGSEEEFELEKLEEVEAKEEDGEGVLVAEEDVGEVIWR